MATAYYSREATFASHSRDIILIELTQTPRCKGREINHAKLTETLFFFCNANHDLHNYLISEQILVQQTSWYTENHAITLLIHLLPQHGTNHGGFAKI